MKVNLLHYYPYGKVLREWNPQAEKYLTTHHERDTETGLDYRGARYYDSDVARFLSLDPLAIDFVSWSPYNYVLGNPVSLIDPTGKGPTDGDGDNGQKQDDGSGVIKPVNGSAVNNVANYFMSVMNQANNPSAKQNNYGEWPLNTLGSGITGTTTPTPFTDRVRKKYDDVNPDGTPVVFNKSYSITQGATFSVNTFGFSDMVEIQSGGSTVLDIGPGPFQTMQDPNIPQNVPHPNAVNGNINVDLNTLFQQGLIQNNTINIRVTPGPQQPTRFDYTLSSPNGGAVLSNPWNIPFGLPLN